MEGGARQCARGRGEDDFCGLEGEFREALRGGGTGAWVGLRVGITRGGVLYV